jgi:hypothetical protein
MAFDAAVLSLAIALLRRGRVSGLADLFDRVRHFWLLAAAFVITIVWFLMLRLPDSIRLPLGGGLHILVTVAFIVFFAMNLRFSGMLFLMIGEALNLLPIAANAGRMPVSQWAILRTGGEVLKGTEMRHVAMSGSTHFNFLADTIPVPQLWRLPGGVISPGDFLVAVGLFVLIQYAMCSLKKPESGATDAA